MTVSRRVGGRFIVDLLEEAPKQISERYPRNLFTSDGELLMGKNLGSQSLVTRVQLERLESESLNMSRPTNCSVSKRMVARMIVENTQNGNGDGFAGKKNCRSYITVSVTKP